MSITTAQALDCFASDDLIGIGMEADAIRRQLHPENIVTYALAEDTPATAPTATEILAQGPDIRATLQRRQSEGLTHLSSQTVILDDALRARIAPNKCSTADWLNIHRTAHTLGLTSTATMIFGVGETTQQRLAHLELLRTLHSETGGFTSFTPIAHPQSITTDPTAVEYLQTLAISRLFLDNIPNIEASLDNQGLKVLQMALRFGANDAGLIPSTGRTTEEDIRRIIRDAGFHPHQRDAAYRILYLV